MTKSFKSIGLAAVLSLGAAGSLSASVLIPGTAEIFSAGQASPFDSMGTLPVNALTFAAGAGQTVSFTSVTGTVGCSATCPTNTADGLNIGGAFTGTNISLANSGLSAIQFTGMEMFLVGVFLDSSTPSGSGPASIGDYGTGAISPLAASYSPLIGQTFFIGDGQGTAGTQVFNVPVTATRLFLGFADGIFFQGTPGAYGDNVGSLTANILLASTPEPSTMVLLALGFAGLALGRKKQLI